MCLPWAVRITISLERQEACYPFSLTKVSSIISSIYRDASLQLGLENNGILERDEVNIFNFACLSPIMWPALVAYAAVDLFTPLPMSDSQISTDIHLQEHSR